MRVARQLRAWRSRSSHPVLGSELPHKCATSDALFSCLEHQGRDSVFAGSLLPRNPCATVGSCVEGQASVTVGMGYCCRGTWSRTIAFGMGSSLRIIAVSIPFPGWPRRHKQVQEARMAGLWRAVMVTMQGSVRPEARPPQALHWYRLLSRFRGTRQPARQSHACCDGSPPTTRT